MPYSCWRYKQKIKIFWPLLPLKSVSWCSATEVMTSAFILTLNSLQKDSLKRCAIFLFYFLFFFLPCCPWRNIAQVSQYHCDFLAWLWLLSTLIFPFFFMFSIFFLHIFSLIARTIYFCSWKNAKFNLSHRTPKMNSGRKGVVEDLGPDCKPLTGAICHFASRIGAMKVL